MLEEISFAAVHFFGEPTCCASISCCCGWGAARLPTCTAQCLPTERGGGAPFLGVRVSRKADEVDPSLLQLLRVKLEGTLLVVEFIEDTSSDERLHVRRAR